MESLVQLRKDLEISRNHLRDPISEQVVSNFELKSGVTLPSDYRHFITEFADGGKFQCNLVQLEDWAFGYYSAVDVESALRSPCMITPELKELGSGWLDSLGIEDHERKWNDDEWDPLFGSITIGEIGCGRCYFLVVNGIHSGRIFVWGDYPENPPVFLDDSSYTNWAIEFLEPLFKVRREQAKTLAKYAPKKKKYFWWR